MLTWIVLDCTPKCTAYDFVWMIMIYCIYYMKLSFEKSISITVICDQYNSFLDTAQTYVYSNERYRTYRNINNAYYLVVIKTPYRKQKLPTAMAIIMELYDVSSLVTYRLAMTSFRLHCCDAHERHGQRISKLRNTAPFLEDHNGGFPTRRQALPWPSCQIRKIAGCACAGNPGNVFPRRRLQRKPLVSNPGMHHGTCFTHVPWCMSGSPTRGGGENVPGIPGACAPVILCIW